MCYPIPLSQNLFYGTEVSSVLPVVVPCVPGKNDSAPRFPPANCSSVCSAVFVGAVLFGISGSCRFNGAGAPCVFGANNCVVVLGLEANPPA